MEVLHIPDGLLDFKTWGTLYGVSGGTTAYALYKVRNTLDEKKIPLLGITAAFIFAAQLLNFPVAAGVSGHFLGAMLACVLLGPWAGFLVMVVVLAIQCLIFADGGFAALGANIFNMALIAGPVCYFMFAASKSLMNKRLSERTSLLTSLAFFSWLSVVLAGAACAVELSISNVVKLSSGAIFGPIVGVNAIIGIGEAVITTIVVAVVLQARPDLIYSYSGHDVKLPLSEEAV
ncbi:MAG TPA: energy-coupling factor ABC transporter permease [Candidatus Anoxymicrobiaceae bacterium]